MVSGRFKSGRFRKVFVRTPGAKNVVHYRERMPKIAKCAECKQPLKGIPRLRATEFKNLAKSQKKTNRPYGGNLCSKCARNKIKESARSLQ